MGVFDGQVALVTGGGSGIGLACARLLATDGATVVLAGRSVDRLTHGAAELAEAVDGADVHVVACDVTDEPSVAAACSTAADLGRFTMVVANAGTGAFLTMKHAVPHLAGNGGGSIVATSSIAAVRTHWYMTAYCVSKAALEMLVRQVADELGRVGIRANAVRPGLVPTDISTLLVDTPSIRDDYVDQMPLGRLGTTDDIARLVRFLLGPESGWITGTCVSADGGHHLRRGPRLGLLTPTLDA
jgi:NAD(P)-dependent dehydrogenase (short-subunit alcohol dehydrogenase family)